MINEIVERRIKVKEEMDRLKKIMQQHDEDIKQYMVQNEFSKLELDIAKISYSKVTSKRLNTSKIKLYLGEKLPEFETKVESERLTITKNKQKINEEQ